MWERIFRNESYVIWELSWNSYRNVRQWTPMDCAAEKGREKIIQLLIDAEADIDPKDIASVSGWSSSYD